MNKNTQAINASELTPTTIKQALNLMSRGFIPVAGGTDLMVRRHAQKKSPGFRGELPPIFSCSKISDTAYISLERNRFCSGSAVSLAEIIAHHHCPEILSESLLSIASPGIRNMASLAGNICNASPAADSLPALYLLNAGIETAALNSDGSVIRIKTPIKDFITGPGKTTADGSLVTSISCERLEEHSWVFRKVGTRAANALSKLSIAAVYRIQDGVFTDFRIAVGACAPTVIRSAQAEKLLAGTPVNERQEIIDRVIEIYEDLIKPIDDQRSTAAYRKNTALKLIREIIITAGD